ncbi:hypothetical protein COCC4DRAFT_31037 [Bipolaris maydis ATCC 48331]|uniref:Uncharacterized protein n=2 Tax=Cochliobolus heterostrophus TaxID=5016 RepID=M2V215_COCH5|nr:uncharacterized protein COCC4DRAFT_31037 [Bipolaris maydis ATCC 48331]EMD93992.1 hypothetical protein COCHEDRAFT_1020133 [Bipolaris maydis C5]ENI07706.1 hypothetical protein COCC4DRAFT_31037 [Bipolaris maydis ATCC 48331]
MCEVYIKGISREQRRRRRRRRRRKIISDTFPTESQFSVSPKRKKEKEKAVIY